MTIPIRQPPRSGARALTAALVTLALICALPGVASAAAVTQLRLALTTPPRLGAIGDDVGYVVLQPWEAGLARRLKAAHPRLTVLVYQNFGSLNAGVGADGLTSSGVGFRAARSAHPSWLLHQSDGAPIAENGYPYLYLADPANPGYQRQWAANVIRVLRRGPWDGVFMDDVNASLQPEEGSAVNTRFATDAAYEAAVGSMLAHVGPRIEATGRIVIANFGEWYDHPRLVASWLRDVDGGMDEKFVKWSTSPGRGYRPVAQWRSQVGEARTAAAMHKRFLAVTSAAPSDDAAALYGWASLLLGAGARASYLSASDYGGTAPSLPEYGLALGAPRGAMSRVRGGAYRRSFSRGLVLVNPTAKAVTVALHGSYSGSGLDRASTAALAPHTGVVLLGPVAAGSRSRSASTLIVVVLIALALWYSMRRRGAGRGTVSREPTRRSGGRRR